jgi:hypothetical protein
MSVAPRVFSSFMIPIKGICADLRLPGGGFAITEGNDRRSVHVLTVYKKIFPEMAAAIVIVTVAAFLCRQTRGVLGVIFPYISKKFLVHNIILHQKSNSWYTTAIEVVQKLKFLNNPNV